ncbi:MAG: hypothetical protein HC912_06625 [Saprospiraceae bacterium]|nr:hypothetical protein [Saprospiraceae bacterium]
MISRGVKKAATTGLFAVGGYYMAKAFKIKEAYPLGVAASFVGTLAGNVLFPEDKCLVSESQWKSQLTQQETDAIVKRTLELNQDVNIKIN